MGSEFHEIEVVLQQSSHGRQMGEYVAHQFAWHVAVDVDQAVEFGWRNVP